LNQNEKVKKPIEFLDLIDERNKRREVPRAAVAVVCGWLAEVEWCV